MSIMESDGTILGTGEMGDALIRANGQHNGYDNPPSIPLPAASSNESVQEAASNEADDYYPDDFRYDPLSKLTFDEQLQNAQIEESFRVFVDDSLPDGTVLPPKYDAVKVVVEDDKTDEEDCEEMPDEEEYGPMKLHKHSSEYWRQMGQQFELVEGKLRRRKDRHTKSMPATKPYSNSEPDAVPAQIEIEEPEDSKADMIADEMGLIFAHEAVSTLSKCKVPEEIDVDERSNWIYDQPASALMDLIDLEPLTQGILDTHKLDELHTDEISYLEKYLKLKLGENYDPKVAADLIQRHIIGPALTEIMVLDLDEEYDTAGDLLYDNLTNVITKFAKEVVIPTLLEHRVIDLQREDKPKQKSEFKPEKPRVQREEARIDHMVEESLEEYDQSLRMKELETKKRQLKRLPESEWEELQMLRRESDNDANNPTERPITFKSGKTLTRAEMRKTNLEKKEAKMSVVPSQNLIELVTTPNGSNDDRSEAVESVVNQSRSKSRRSPHGRSKNGKPIKIEAAAMLAVLKARDIGPNRSNGYKNS